MGITIPKGDLTFETAFRLLIPVVFATVSFFSWIVLVNSLHIPFYMYYERTIFLVYVDRSIDPLIWLLSSEVALILYALSTRTRSVWFSLSILTVSSGVVTGILAVLGTVATQLLTVGSLLTMVGCAVAGFGVLKASPSSRRDFAVVFLLVLSLLILPAEIGSLLYYVASAFQPGITVGKSWELLELQLWYTAFPLIPFLYVAFLFSWIWIPLILRIFPTLKKKHAVPANSLDRGISPKKERTWLWLMGPFILTSVFLGLYPYFHDASYPLVGTDIYWHYARPAQRVISSGTTIEQWTNASISEDHPLAVLLVVIASSFARLEPELLLRYVYVFLTLASGASVFFLIKCANGDNTVASLGAVVTTISPSTTVGVYTGIVANWMALIVWTVSFALAAQNVSSFRRRAWITIGLAVGSAVVLFLHPWTWIAFVASLIAYSVLLLMHHRKIGLHGVFLVALFILMNGIALILSFLYHSKVETWTAAPGALTLIQRSMNSGYLGVGSLQILSHFSQLWSSFLNPTLLVLSVLGVFVLARRFDRIGFVVFALIVASCLTTLGAAPLGYRPPSGGQGESLIWRAFFLTPFQIPATFGILSLYRWISVRLGGTSKVQLTAALVVAIVALVLTNGTLRALFPLLMDPHNYALFGAIT